MWDFSFLTPCALMLFTVLGFYFSEPHLPIRANRTFLVLLMVELAVMGSDIVSTLADEHYESLSIGALYAANMLFFVFYFARTYCFYRFSLHVVHVASEVQPRLEALLSLPFWVSEAICLSSVYTGAIFSIDATGYHSGPLYKLLYVCSFLYIGLSLFVLATRGKGLYRFERDGVLAYNAALLIGNAMRLLMPRVLVMDTFCTIAITIIFFGFMNPHLFIDQRRIAYNKRGLRLVLSEALEEEGLHVMGLVLRNYQRERVIVGGERVDATIANICTWITETFPHNVLFYMGSGRFALTGDDSVNWDEVHQKIRARFAEPWQTGGSSLNLGVLFVNIDETSGLNSADQIINTLSLSLESAERNESMISDASKDTLSIGEVYEQVMTIREIERALEYDEVEVFLQPIVLGSSHSLVGAEALARIRDDFGSIIPPSLFIPIAEQVGLIDELGAQVFRKVCAFIATHDIEAMGLQWININLSPLQCIQHDIADRFGMILKQYDVSPDLIHLEVTEQSLIDYSLVKNQIVQLCDMGFRFSLDDYGTGYSNLVRLSDYPFANIKLDMSLVRNYSNGKDNLLPVVVSGLKGIGYTITAEGVETEEMANSLSDIGADFLQGYLFARPLPIDEFVDTYGSPDAA